jgi:multidrug efflux pump subunit AcrA (membrane-fusion protein)
MDGRQKYQSAYASYQSAQNNLVTAQNKLLDLESTLVNTKNIFVNQWANQSPDDPTYIQRHNAYLSAEAALESQKNVIKQAQISVEASRLAYQQSGSTVYAPISGTVSAISLTPGMILNPTSSASNSTNLENKIAIVKTAATPAVTVNLTEIDVTKVKYGDKATITLDAIPDKTFTGKIIAVDTAGISSSGVTNYPTTIQFDNDVPEILSKMSAQAKIITEVKDNVIMVPISAVSSSNGISTVRIMRNGNPQTVTVETGISNDSMIEIVSGINEGETMVTGQTGGSSTNSQSNTQSPFSNFGRGMGGGAVRINR